MDGRKRAQQEDERERRAAEAPAALAHPLLELQRGAGNRAVSALVARDAKPKEKPKQEPAAKGTRATLPGIGTIPLESVQFGTNRPTGRPRGREEEGEKEQTGGEIVLTSKAGEHSSALFAASLQGKPMDVEVVIAGSAGTLTLNLKGAIISSMSVHEDIETWTLNFKSMDQAAKENATEEAPQ
jgi:hypothetical protein